MNITLTPELENLVKEEISSGNFESPHEVLREGLLLLKEMKLSRQERIENLRREVQKGVDAIRNGQYKTYQSDDLDNFAENIIERGTKKLNGKNGEKLNG